VAGKPGFSVTELGEGREKGLCAYTPQLSVVEVVGDAGVHNITIELALQIMVTCPFITT
jgi:hypothetical protein